MANIIQRAMSFFRSFFPKTNPESVAKATTPSAPLPVVDDFDTIKRKAQFEFGLSFLSILSDSEKINEAVQHRESLAHTDEGGTRKGAYLTLQEAKNAGFFEKNGTLKSADSCYLDSRVSKTRENVTENVIVLDAAIAHAKQEVNLTGILSQHRPGMDDDIEDPLVIEKNTKVATLGKYLHLNFLLDLTNQEIRRDSTKQPLAPFLQKLFAGKAEEAAKLPAPELFKQLSLSLDGSLSKGFSLNAEKRILAKLQGLAGDDPEMLATLNTLRDTLRVKKIENTVSQLSKLVSSPENPVRDTEIHNLNLTLIHLAGDNHTDWQSLLHEQVSKIFDEKIKSLADTFTALKNVTDSPTSQTTTAKLELLQQMRQQTREISTLRSALQQIRPFTVGQHLTKVADEYLVKATAYLNQASTHISTTQLNAANNTDQQASLKNKLLHPGYTQPPWTARESQEIERIITMANAAESELPPAPVDPQIEPKTVNEANPQSQPKWAAATKQLHADNDDDLPPPAPSH